MQAKWAKGYFTRLKGTFIRVKGPFAHFLFPKNRSRAIVQLGVTMVDRLTAHIYNLMTGHIELSPKEAEILTYMIASIVGELSKVLLLILVFGITGYLQLFLKGFVALILIRSYTGGLHFNSYLKCLLFSLLFFIIIILLNNHVTIHLTLVTLMYLCGFVIVTFIGPIPSKNRAPIDPSRKKYFKVISCSVVIAHYIGFIIVPDSEYFTIASWVIFIQLLLVLITKSGEYYEKNQPPSLQD